MLKGKYSASGCLFCLEGGFLCHSWDWLYHQYWIRYGARSSSFTHFTANSTSHNHDLSFNMDILLTKVTYTPISIIIGSHFGQLPSCSIKSQSMVSRYSILTLNISKTILSQAIKCLKTSVYHNEALSCIMWQLFTC